MCILVYMQVLVYVDNKEHSAEWSTIGNFTDITSRELYVGGAADVRLLNGSKATQNFIGCLRGVSYNYYAKKIVHNCWNTWYYKNDS